MNWEERYLSEDTPWDKGSAAPILEWLLEHKAVLLNTKKSALVPGCGVGHDAYLLADAGIKTQAMDISATALEQGQELYQHPNLSWKLGNLFKDLGKAQYDLIWEHTCYCAIEPSQRDSYIETMHRALEHNGMLLGIFFIDTGMEEGEGPPYRTSLEELENRFNKWFNLEWQLSPPVSYPGREGCEHLILWRRLPTCLDHTECS